MSYFLEKQEAWQAIEAQELQSKGLSITLAPCCALCEVMGRQITGNPCFSGALSKCQCSPEPPVHLGLPGSAWLKPSQLFPLYHPCKVSDLTDSLFFFFFKTYFLSNQFVFVQRGVCGVPRMTPCAWLGVQGWNTPVL